MSTAESDNQALLPGAAALEQEVNASGLDFVIARPPLLKDDPAKGSITVLDNKGTGHEITRADLAQFLVDQFEINRYVGSC